jgi:hypothetical protein
MTSDRVVNHLCTGLIVACVGVLGVTASLLAVPQWRAHFVEAEHPSYGVGTRIDVPDRLYNGGDRTLLMFAHGNCAAAVKAQPQLRQLVAAFIAQTGGRVVLIVPNEQEQAADNVAFAAAVGVELGALYSADFRSLRLRVVPTAVMLDRTGRVLLSQEGFVSDADVHAFLAGVPRMTASRIF